MWQSNGAGLAAQCELEGRTGDACQLSHKLLTDFARAHIFWILVVVFLYMLSNYFRAARWRDMMRGIGYEISLFNSFAALMVGYFANLGVPRSGEFIRAGLLAKYDTPPVEKAFGTIVLERIVDLILFALMIALGFVFHYDKLFDFIASYVPSMGKGYALPIVLTLLIGGGVMGLYLLRRLINKEDQGDSVILTKVKGLVQGFMEGLGSIRRLPNLPLFVFQSVAIWALYFLMHYCAFFSFDPTSMLGWRDAIFVFDFGSLGIVLPAPGGMGTFHYLIEESLYILGIDRLDGFSLAMILFFTINIGCNALFGLLSLIALPLINK